jgi:uncharacterized protein YjbI with pentapeptide repeats
MANQQHLDLLHRGVSSWNTWMKEQSRDFIADFIDANLNDADLRGVDLRRANLSGADLREADLIGAHLFGANFSRVDLRNAYLYRADFSRANLSEANLSEAILRKADLSRADLSRADLSRVDLNETIFSGTLLCETILSRANVGWTIFGDLDLRTVKGLETVIHEGPSTIGTDTIERSQGDIPEVFLRGAGLSEAFIAFVHSMKK